MFDINHELYLISVRPEQMSFMQTIILSFKLLYNIMIVSLITTMPIAFLFGVATALDYFFPRAG